MRTAVSVRPNPSSAPAIVLAALLLSLGFGLVPFAAAFEGDADTPADVERPAEVAPDGSEAAPTEAQPDVPGGRRELDRGVFRPELRPGSEGAGAPDAAGGEGLAPNPDEFTLASPADKPRILAELYVQLAKAEDAAAAAPIVTNIEALWRKTGSPTVDLLIGRAERFIGDKDLDLALQILDATVAMAPEEAEAWYLRAKVRYAEGKYDLARTDLDHAVERDPNHYRALEELGLVYEALGKKFEALAAYRKALAVNPFLNEAEMAVKFLEKEIGARNL